MRRFAKRIEHLVEPGSVCLRFIAQMSGIEGVGPEHGACLWSTFLCAKLIYYLSHIRVCELSEHLNQVPTDTCSLSTAGGAAADHVAH
jgi:hypothetical protein